MKSEAVMKCHLFALVLVFSGLAPSGFSRQKAVESGLRQFVDAGGTSGLVAAMVTPEGTDFFSYGSISEDPERTLDEHTQFAVASISKLFTTLALVELMREGKLRFEDTVDAHLPAGIQLPSKEGKAITLAHLATHTSGIPTDTDRNTLLMASMLGWNHALKNLYQKPLVSVPGSKFQYSNPGLALLGHVGELVDGRGYEAMVRARVLAPLGMQDTWVKKPSNAQAPVGAFTIGIFAPAGGFNSNAIDLAKFATGALGGAPEPLKRAFELSYEPQGKDEGGRELHLGWHGGADAQQLNHTGLNNIYLGVDLKRHVGVVILCTDQTPLIGDLGQSALSALGGASPTFPRPKKAVQLTMEELQSYVGEYHHESAGDVQLKADTKKGALLITFPGKGESVLWPLEGGSFYCKEWRCELAFVPAAEGESAYVTITMSHWAGDYVKK